MGWELTVSAIMGRHLGKAVATLAMTGVLAIGLGSAGARAENFFTRFLKGGDNAPETSKIDPNYFLEKGYCPQLRVRPGTESVLLRDGKGEDPGNVRYLLRIQDSARECTASGDSMTIRIGVAGRVVGGPKATAGKVALPIRIVATKGLDEVIYSKLNKAEVAVGADYTADFSEVYEITIPRPAENDIRLYAGFDETGKADPLTGKAPPEAKTVARPRRAAPTKASAPAKAEASAESEARKSEPRKSEPKKSEPKSCNFPPC
jgi:hypothetical protein